MVTCMCPAAVTNKALCISVFFMATYSHSLWNLKTKLTQTLWRFFEYIFSKYFLTRLSAEKVSLNLNYGCIISFERFLQTTENTNLSSTDEPQTYCLSYAG